MFTTIDPNKDISKNEASAREIATCKQNVGQKEDLMHSNFQMDIDYHGWMQRLLNTSRFT